MGPTASGKTALAMALYKQQPERFVLINVDSALIYRGMDIGTAKPTKAELEAAPHALVDIVDPAESYSVGNFLKDVTALIDQAHAENKIPVLVGGTMMYYRALLGQIDTLPASTDASRAYVQELYAKHTNQEVHALLAQIDPPAFSRLHYNDRQRVGRVLEVHYLTGKGISEISNNDSAVSKNLAPLTDKERSHKVKRSQAAIQAHRLLFNTPHYNLEDYLVDLEDLAPSDCLPLQNQDGLWEYKDAKGQEFTSKYRLVQFSLYNKDRAELHAEIDKRLADQVRDGLVEEVKALYDRGDLDLSMSSVRCVAYRQLWPHFSEGKDLDTCLQEVIYATRQLAKRQITWLRSWPLPFTQIPTYLSLEQKMAIVEKVLGFVAAQDADGSYRKPEPETTKAD